MKLSSELKASITVADTTNDEKEASRIGNASFKVHPGKKASKEISRTTLYQVMRDLWTYVDRTFQFKKANGDTTTDFFFDGFIIGGGSNKERVSACWKDDNFADL